jgi:hypothetical protein
LRLKREKEKRDREEKARIKALKKERERLEKARVQAAVAAALDKRFKIDNKFALNLQKIKVIQDETVE